MLRRDVPIDIKCPKCGEKIVATLGELERDDDVSCAGCGLRIVGGPEMVQKLEADIRETIRRCNEGA